MSEDFEALISQALTDHGGPPEIAPQLIAIAEQNGLTRVLPSWIHFHRQDEWSAAQFTVWCGKYRAMMERLEKGGNTLENR